MLDYYEVTDPDLLPLFGFLAKFSEMTPDAPSLAFDVPEELEMFDYLRFVLADFLLALSIGIRSNGDYIQVLKGEIASLGSRLDSIDTPKQPTTSTSCDCSNVIEYVNSLGEYVDNELDRIYDFINDFDWRIRDLENRVYRLEYGV